MNRKDKQKELADIFGDTEYIYTTNETLQKAIKNSGKGQYVWEETEPVPEGQDKKRYQKAAKITVSPHRTLEAARYYKGQKVAVLNFASATCPGGSVLYGGSAQEESLCRCSTLYANLSQDAVSCGFHRVHRIQLRDGRIGYLYNDDCVYTPQVVVFKSDTGRPQLLEESEWYTVDVITCAAPNLREFSSQYMDDLEEEEDEENISDKELEKIHKKRAKRVFELAKKEQVEVLILGAFGCGAFLNPPEVVAHAWKQVAKEYVHDFKVIEFAVYCSQKDSFNYDIFKEEIEG